MRFLALFYVASMPVLKVLLLTALGSFLALDRVHIMGEGARKQLNRVVFYVFNPAQVASNLAKTITFENITSMWFMPINILFTFIIGSALGWMLIKITRPPKHLQGLVLGCCAAGNMGNLPIIIIPAVCKERGSPFGPADVCYSYGIAYASLSMAIGAIYLWSLVYNIVRISSPEEIDGVDNDDSKSNMKGTGETQKPTQGNYSEPLLPSKSVSAECHILLPPTESDRLVKVQMSDKIKRHLRMISRKLNLKAMFTPSIIGAIAGFAIGVVPKLRNSLIGTNAPLHVVEDSTSLLGEAAIPTITLIAGGNLLRGLRGSGVRLSLIIGILAVRYLLLPLIGIIIVKSAVRFGLVHQDPLYQFILLLQFALPSAMNIGTIVQLFGAGESECSVIMLWQYAFASISLTLWSTLFMWLVA